MNQTSHLSYDANLEERYQSCRDLKRKLFADGEYVIDAVTGERCYALPFFCKDDEDRRTTITRFIETSRDRSHLFRSTLRVVAMGEYYAQPALILRLPDGEVTSLRDIITNRVGWNLEMDISLVRAVAVALQDAHVLGLVICNLSPDNIFIHNTKCIFGVLGASCLGDESSYHHPIAILHSANIFPLRREYIAPEVISNSHRSVSSRTDMYALGVIAYEIITRKLPDNSRRIEGNGGISDYIHQCLSIVPDGRPSRLQEFIERLSGHSAQPGNHTRFQRQIRLISVVAILIVYASLATWFAVSGRPAIGNSGTVKLEDSTRYEVFQQDEARSSAIDWQLPSWQQSLDIMGITQTQNLRKHRWRTKVPVVPTGSYSTTIHPSLFEFRAQNSSPSRLADVDGVEWFMVDVPRFCVRYEQTPMEKMDDEVVQRIETLPVPTDGSAELPEYIRADLWSLLTEGAGFEFRRQFTVVRAEAIEVAATALSRQGYQLDAARFQACAVRSLRELWKGDQAIEMMEPNGHSCNAIPALLSSAEFNLIQFLLATDDSLEACRIASDNMVKLAFLDLSHDGETIRRDNLCFGLQAAAMASRNSATNIERSTAVVLLNKYEKAVSNSGLLDATVTPSARVHILCQIGYRWDQLHEPEYSQRCIERGIEILYEDAKVTESIDYLEVAAWVATEIQRQSLSEERNVRWEGQLRNVGKHLHSMLNGPFPDAPANLALRVALSPPQDKH
jgi:serine/threonine protein kinase